MASKADNKRSPSKDSTSTSLRPSSRRSNSLSSSPSLSSSSNSSLSSMFFPDVDSPISPTTPLRFSGIPFSWEKLPGIPKKLQNSKNYKHNHNIYNDPSSTITLLPLPPSSRKLKNHKETFKKYNNNNNNTSHESLQKDPFFAALVECSKDDEDAIANYWKGSKVNNHRPTSTITDRLGFISIYTSCKRTCAVSESIVYLPRSTPHYLLNRR